MSSGIIRLFVRKIEKYNHTSNSFEVLDSEHFDQGLTSKNSNDMLNRPLSILIDMIGVDYMLEVDIVRILRRYKIGAVVEIVGNVEIEYTPGPYEYPNDGDAHGYLNRAKHCEVPEEIVKMFDPPEEETFPDDEAVRIPITV